MKEAPLLAYGVDGDGKWTHERVGTSGTGPVAKPIPFAGSRQMFPATWNGLASFRTNSTASNVELQRWDTDNAGGRGYCLRALF